MIRSSCLLSINPTKVLARCPSHGSGSIRYCCKRVAIASFVHCRVSDSHIEKFGLRIWPPAWLYCAGGGGDNTYPLGEVGILKTVFVSAVKPSTRCYLIMEHAGAEYMGELLISDAGFCNEIYEVLLRHCGKTIQEIGDIDLIEREPEHSTQESTPLALRHHPLMTYRGVPNWPPTWTWIGGLENKFPRGEIGIFKSATLSKILPANKCYLYIDHEGSSYIGCLLFDDHDFCRQLTEILQFCCNRSIAEIGGLDLSHTL